MDRLYDDAAVSAFPHPAGCYPSILVSCLLELLLHLPLVNSLLFPYVSAQRGIFLSCVVFEKAETSRFMIIRPQYLLSIDVEHPVHIPYPMLLIPCVLL